MVKSNVAIVGPRVRFPAGALYILLISLLLISHPPYPRRRDMTYAQPPHAFPEAPARTNRSKKIHHNYSWLLLWGVWDESVLTPLSSDVISLPSPALTQYMLQQPIVTQDPLFGYVWYVLWPGCCVVFMRQKISFKHTPTKKTALTLSLRPLGHYLDDQKERGRLFVCQTQFSAFKPIKCAQYWILTIKMLLSNCSEPSNIHFTIELLIKYLRLALGFISLKGRPSGNVLCKN